MEVSINPTTELSELTQDWGNRLLEGANKTLCTPGPRRREQWPHKRLTQTCLWVPGVSGGSICQWWLNYRVGGTKCTSACIGPFEGGCHYLHYLHHSLASGQITRNRTETTTENWIKDLLSMAHQQKTGLKIYWAWPCPSEQGFPLSQSLPSGNFHKLLILLHQKADRLKTTITEI